VLRAHVSARSTATESILGLINTCVYFKVNDTLGITVQHQRVGNGASIL
jgi:hypothetical protein